MAVILLCLCVSAFSEMLAGDELELQPTSQINPHLPNSEMLQKFSLLLGHLLPEQQSDVRNLVRRYPRFFSDVPS